MRLPGERGIRKEARYSGCLSGRGTVSTHRRRRLVYTVPEYGSCTRRGERCLSCPLFGAQRSVTGREWNSLFSAGRFREPVLFSRIWGFLLLFPIPSPAFFLFHRRNSVKFRRINKQWVYRTSVFVLDG